MAKFTVTQKGVAFKSAEYDFLSDAVKRARKEAIKSSYPVSVHRADCREVHIFCAEGTYRWSEGADGIYQSDYVSRL